MSTEELQRRTAANVQEKANLIWAIADKLVGTYKPHEYGQIILPMCVIKRFSDCLAETHDEVIEEYESLGNMPEEMKAGFLTDITGFDFYNTSKFTLPGLLADSDNIGDNFKSYLNHFSANVIDILKNFDFDRHIEKMEKNGVLFNVIHEFCTEKAYMGVDLISAVDMGYIFEELVRKFSESYDEQAGAHFTARDIIYLMATLLISPRKEQIARDGLTASIYDMAMGTSQMLDCLSEKIHAIAPSANLTEFGQELNDQTFAIAKANALIKGQDANNMKLGNTLSDDQLKYSFDYIISNPPFGIEWKNEEEKVRKEHLKGEQGRFAPGLPSIADSQQLFVLNGCAKLKDDGRMAIIQNGSPLFKMDAGSGESKIRGYLLENDWLEAIVQMPTDMFYNAGIATYIWIVTKHKTKGREGKVQLIDASACSVKLRKPIGNKRNEFSDDCIELIERAYLANEDCTLTNGDLSVESKVFPNEYFKYTKLYINRPLRLRYKDLTLPPEDVLNGLKKADRDFITDVVAKYQECMNGKELLDKDFFDFLKKNGIKPSAPQIKRIRQLLGTKDPEVHEVYANPYKPKDGYWAWDPELADTEYIPWLTDIQEYLDKNVEPYAPDYRVDESKTAIGYEIPFTREFYKYVAPSKSSEIFDRLKELDEKEKELMDKILG